MSSVAIIGLSSFGYYLCKYLAGSGVEVMAIDVNRDKIDDVKEFIRNAVIADASDRDVLERLSVNEFDTVVISVGEHMDTSILITLHLREMGVKNIIAKAITEDHARILNMMKVSRIVFPEKDIAHRFARLLQNNKLLDYYSLDEDYSVIEMASPNSWNGKSLLELDLRRKYGVQVIMIHELLPEKKMIIPSGGHIIKDSDTLTIIGDNKALDRIGQIE
jgi:trk system potassium uptake protein TrkA